MESKMWSTECFPMSYVYHMLANLTTVVLQLHLSPLVKKKGFNCFGLSWMLSCFDRLSQPSVDFYVYIVYSLGIQKEAIYAMHKRTPQYLGCFKGPSTVCWKVVVPAYWRKYGKCGSLMQCLIPGFFILQESSGSFRKYLLPVYILQFTYWNFCLFAHEPCCYIEYSA